MIDPCMTAALNEILFSLMTRPGITLADVKSTHSQDYLKARLGDLVRLGLIQSGTLWPTWKLVRAHNCRLRAWKRYDLSEVLTEIVEAASAPNDPDQYRIDVCPANNA